MKTQAKKLGVLLTIKRKNKKGKIGRVYKSPKVLKKQIANAKKKKSKKKKPKKSSKKKKPKKSSKKKKSKSKAKKSKSKSKTKSRVAKRMAAAAKSKSKSKAKSKVKKSKAKRKMNAYMKAVQAARKSGADFFEYENKDGEKYRYERRDGARGKGGQQLADVFVKTTKLN